MYRLLIVDDERKTREGLKKVINWDEYNITQIETAEDGIEALELIKGFSPDIILCDVRMPRMDGIEFARKIRENNELVQIIFLSGYSDKEYLKAAIQVSAVSYIEKPVDKDELTEIVQKAVKALKKIVKSKYDEAISSAAQDKFSRHKLLIGLLNGNIDLPYINKQAETLGLNFSLHNFYYAVSVVCTGMTGLEKLKMEAIKDKAIETLEDTLAGIKSDILFDFISDHKIAIVASSCDSPREPASRATFQKIIDLLEELCECRVIMGVGKCMQGWDNVKESFRMSEYALEKFFFLGRSIIFYEEISSQKVFEFDKNYCSTFLDHLMHRDFEGSIDIVNGITDKLRECINSDIAYVKHFLFTILLQMFKIKEYEDLEYEEILESEKYIWKVFASLNTIDEIKSYIIRQIRTLEEYRTIKTGKSKIVCEALQFIDQNFTQDINVNIIAEKLYITPSYLSLIFKKELRKPCNNYISERRIEKAKELLRDGKTKLSDIAAKVGFSDSNYFAKVFKRITGVTPSQYRGQ